MQREAAGVRYRLSEVERTGAAAVAAVATEDDADDWEYVEDEDNGAAGGAAAPRRRRVKKMVTFVPNPAEAADGLNLWSAGATATEVEDAEISAMWPAAKSVTTRKVPKSWEDDEELNIDAI
jgi:hypothetical protein